MRPIFSRDLPIYKQLSESIKSEIIDGSLTGGEKLPSIRENAAENNVSLVTMMNAYRDLEEQGLISGSGDGYRVNAASSVYVNEFYLKKIEQLYRELRECCARIGLDDVSGYLKKLDDIIGDSGEKK